jgi:2-polyprenyl-6-hydroxyphenyl methylase/3-demethylubiquinone-9 3-methyltransferase
MAGDDVTENSDDDAVRHFSEQVGVEQFHAYYEDRPEFRERLDLWYELLDKHNVGGGLALDMGCGTGVFSFYLAQKSARVVGIDGSPDMVRFCDAQRANRHLENIRFVEGRLPDLDVTGLTNADLVISSSVVEYVEDLDATLGLFARLLKPRGALILSMPSLFCLNRAWDRLMYRLTGRPPVYRYIRHFTSPGLLQRRVRRHHLSLEEVRYYDHRSRLARVMRAIRLPLPVTEDLFVAVFRKS